MQYGLCYLSVVALRLEASDTSELVSQVLYGDFFKVLEQRKCWSRIRLAYDKYEGWVDNKQFKFIEESDYNTLQKDPTNSEKEAVEQYGSSDSGASLGDILGAALNTGDE